MKFLSKIRSFPEVSQTRDESFFQELYDEVYEKKHSKLEPVDGELVRHGTSPRRHVSGVVITLRLH